MPEKRISTRLREAIDQAQECCDMLLQIEVILKVSEDWPSHSQHVVIEQIREVFSKQSKAKRDDMIESLSHK